MDVLCVVVAVGMSIITDGKLVNNVVSLNKLIVQTVFLSLPKLIFLYTYCELSGLGVFWGVGGVNFSSFVQLDGTDCSARCSFFVHQFCNHPLRPWENFNSKWWFFPRKA